MANFTNDLTGREAAETLITTRMVAGTWVEGHQGQDESGNVYVRFIRPMSPTNPDYGAWITSRDDAAS